MAKPRKPWLDLTVYFAVRIVVAFLQALPLDQAKALARML
ncbi:MAG: hypothetical protein RIR17_2477, partial [Planctomycetota bacterium]